MAIVIKGRRREGGRFDRSGASSGGTRLKRSLLYGLLLFRSLGKLDHLRNALGIEFGGAFEGELQEHARLVARDPIRLLRLHAVVAPGRQPIQFAALDGKRDIGTAFVTAHDLELRSEEGIEDAREIIGR